MASLLMIFNNDINATYCSNYYFKNTFVCRKKERMLRGMHAITTVNSDFVQHTDSVLESAGFLLYLAQCSVLKDQMLTVLIVHTLYSNENIHYRILYGFRLGGNIVFA